MISKTQKLAITLLSIVLLSLGSLSTLVGATKEVELTGHWQGELVVGGNTLPLLFDIAKESTGSYRSTMDSPAQGAKDIPIAETTLIDGKVMLNIEVAGAIYEGSINADGDRIIGHWQQSGNSFPLVLERQQGKTEVAFPRPQEPKLPYPYVSQEVEFKNERAGNSLAGTITLPKGTGSFPAVILIIGSGPQDRDQNWMGHRTFLILADHFTRQGMAVLRVDDRGVGKSTGDFSQATSADFATDVQAGIDYLKTREDIESNNIGLVGHSEGGLIAPMVAVNSTDVDFIILMAGPGIPGSDISTRQFRDILEFNGLSEATVNAGAGIYQRLNMATIQQADTGLMTEYVNIEETISPAALELMSDWILSVVHS